MGRKPTSLPPEKEALRQLSPGRAVIHSNPLNYQIDKLPRALFVQRANEALAKMNAKLEGELVTVTGAQVMNSGDVHADLEATPSTWSVLVHGIPKKFNPASEINKSSLATANHLKKEDIVRMRWLSDHMHTAKRAGSIVLSLANKDLAEKLTHTGIFLDYDYHRVTKFKPYPAQCFKCLRMGHYGKWCRRTARCGRCDGEHMTKDCPMGLSKLMECVRCKEGLRNKEEGIDNTHHSVFSTTCPIKMSWIKAKKSTLQTF